MSLRLTVTAVIVTYCKNDTALVAVSFLKFKIDNNYRHSLAVNVICIYSLGVDECMHAGRSMCWYVRGGGVMEIPIIYWTTSQVSHEKLCKKGIRK
jgi:hypothetical protein